MYKLAALLKVDLRGNISKRTKQLCAYADDDVIIARTQKGLKENFVILQKEAENLGLIINTNKTKYIQVAPPKKQTNSVALIRTQTIPTERPPPVGEVSANF